MLRHQRFKFVRAAFFLRGKHELLMKFARKKSIWKLEILLTFSALLRGLQIFRGIYDSPLIRYN